MRYARMDRNNRTHLRRKYLGPACEECGESDPEVLDIDHVLEVQDGGTDAPENLRTLCANDHRRKTLAYRRMKKLVRRMVAWSR